jgi:hypothetical protein
MYQSGKIVGRCSTALSAAATVSVVTLFVAARWIVPAPDVKPAKSVAAKSTPATSSEQAMTAPEQAPTSIEDVRALVETVAGPEPASAPQVPALQILSHDAPEAAAPQPGEAAALSPQWSETEVAAALMECVNLLAPINAQVVPLAPLRYGDCGTPAPVLLRSFGGKDKVAVDPPMLMNCPMVIALNRWLDKVVQPSARATLGSPVTRLVGSSYACRNLYNLPNERRSQHAFANAIDLPVFFLADGRRVDLATGWGPTRRDLVAGAKLVPIVAKTATAEAEADAVVPAKGTAAGMTVPVKASAGEAVDATPTESEPNAKPPVPDPLSLPEAKFLRRVHDGACEVFSTVLGPEANDVHRTHLHLDLQERHSLNVCQ